MKVKQGYYEEQINNKNYKSEEKDLQIKYHQKR